MNLINEHSKILIIGDSWGCGEWRWSRPGVGGPVHPGLELYLKEYGCDVTNLSVGGSSNSEILDRLNDCIKINNSYDVIIWFQTDPLRDLQPYADNIEIFKKDKEDFILVHDELLDSIYAKFNSLNLPIYCLGGTTKLNLELLKKYPNLHPVIPSIIEMFGEVHIRIWPSSTWIKDPQVLKSLSHSLVDYLHSECNPKLSQEWFHPDGKHPNRKAHKKIFEFLIDFKLPESSLLQ